MKIYIVRWIWDGGRFERRRLFDNWTDAARQLRWLAESGRAVVWMETAPAAVCQGVPE